MNRGAGRRPLFLSARHGRYFLRLIGEGCEASGVEVHAYCLMGNHFHLIVHCPVGGLSAFMHRLGSLYARHLNRQLDSDGPVFRGRFRSLLVDTPEYLVCASRYVHRNPLDRRPLVPLDRYPWSSYASYVTGAVGPSWLRTAVLLEAHGGRRRVREFTEEGDAPSAPPTWWCVDTAIAELDEGGRARPHLRRSVAVAMLDRADGVLRDDLVRALDFPSDTARRMAVLRTRRRLVADPSVIEMATRALALARRNG